MTKRTLCLGLLGTAVGLLGCSDAVTSSGADDGGAPVADCTKYLSQPPGSMVTFTVKNNRAAPVYLHDGECIPRFSIVAQGLPEATGGEQPTKFDLSCDKAQLRPAPWDCGDPGVGVVPLAAGATTMLTWQGLMYESRTMPEACYGQPLLMITPCAQGMTAKPGAMQVSVIAFGSANCPGGDNACLGHQDDVLTATQSFNYPSDQQVEVDIN